MQFLPPLLRAVSLGSLAGLLTLAVPLAAQEAPTGTVSGRITNAGSGSRLANVRVVADGTGVEAYTNSEGEYRLVVPAGSVNLRATYLDLMRETARVEVPRGATANHDFEFRGLGPESAVRREEVVKLAEFTVAERELSAQAAAIQEQRAAPNVKNVVSFEEFGDLGEGNVGEFLKFVPGVQIDQNPGVASSALIRGMPASGTLMMVDGLELASDTPASRGPSFTGTNTGNIDRIEITKVPTPDMPANAVGGMINIVSKGGFSRSRPLFTYNAYGTLTTLEAFRNLRHDLFVTSGPDRSTHQSNVRPGVDLTYIYPVNSRVAVSLSAGHNSRWEDKDYLAPTWNRVTNIQTASSLNAAMAMRVRDLASARVDWKPTPHHTLFATAEASTDDVYSRQHAFNQTYGTGATGGEFFTQGASTGVGSVTQALTYRNQLKWTGYAALGHRYEDGPWRADWTAGYSQARRRTLSTDLGFFGTVSATLSSLVLRADGLDGIYSRTPPRLTATDRTGNAVNVYDGRLYTINTATSPQEPLMSNSIGTFKANAARDFTGSLPLRLSAGVSVSTNHRDLQSATSSWSFRPPAGTTAQVAGLYDVINAGYSDDRRFKDGSSVRWLDPRKLYQLYQANPTWFALNESSAHISKVNGSSALTETISAAYLRGDLRLLDNRLWLVGGVRLERTEDHGRGPLNDLRATFQQDAQGNLLRDATGKPIAISTDALTLARAQYTERGSASARRYEGYYPSLNASYSLTENFVTRAAYARTIGRPDLSLIIPNKSVADPSASDSNRVINVTNSGLRPWTADNYDVSFESYTFKGATTSASLFRKEISGFFTSTRSPATLALLTEMGLTDDYLNYDVVTTGNSSDAVALSGVELSWRQALRPFQFLPGWTRNLSGYVNATFYRLSGAGADNFTGYSPRNVAWGLAYTNARLLAKINVAQTLRTRNNLTAVSSSVPAGTFDAVDFRLLVDLSAEFRLFKHLALYGSARNANGYPKYNVTYSPNAPAYTRPRSYQYYGTLLTFGIKGTF